MTKKKDFTSPFAISCYFALAKLILHLLTNRQYGFFRDELYFIACGEHLDWGYVDHAPMVAVFAKLSRVLFGESLAALRFFPALSGAFKVLLTGLIAREMGGRHFAVALACLATIFAPVYLGTDTLYSMNTFEPLCWMGCAYAILLVINREDPRYLLLFGLCAGLGLQNKHSMIFFGFGMFVGILATPLRQQFLQRWIWLAGALTFLIFLPNIIWQYQHDFATLTLLSNVKNTGKNVVLSPIEFMLQQMLIMGPLSTPIWLSGLGYLLFHSNGRRYRVLGICYLTVLVVMIILKGKNYYLAPIYPMMFAAGGVCWQELTENSRSWMIWLRWGYAALFVVASILLVPLALPILPVDTFITYQEKIGIKPPKTEVAHQGKLPQHYGDMFGWPEMVEKVAQVYHSLPPEEKAKAAIFAGNYGEAGAIDKFGGQYGLPKAISTHQNYFFWGPRDYTGEVIIVLQADQEEVAEVCQRVEAAGEIRHPYAMKEEQYTIFICRGLKRPLSEYWPKWRHWN